MTSSDSKAASIQTHFQTLSSIAPTLNAASNELTQAVSVLDEALKKLNIGLSTWVTFRSRRVEPWECDDDQIGYTKVDGDWGIAIRGICGDTNTGDFEFDGPWKFKDSPRELRLLAVDELPRLIESLSKEALKTTKKVQEKTKQVRELATAITEIAQSPNAKETTPSAGISPEQVQAIIEGVGRTNKSTGELLHHATHWSRSSDELHICFPFEKSTFADLLGNRKSLRDVNSVANHVLGMPLIVRVHVVGNAATQNTEKEPK